MYVPEAFEITDSETVTRFLQEHPFGVLVVNGYDGVPVATHLPFLLLAEGEKLVIEGHIAKANGQQPYLQKGKPAKMIVSGAHGYVSSSVYGHVNVPTYNYQAVHVSGTIDLLNDEELLDHLKKVVGSFEQYREEPVVFDRWPEEMIAGMMRAITGFRLTVFKTEAAFKLSQNRNESDFRRITEDLQNSGNASLANEMLKTRK